MAILFITPEKSTAKTRVAVARSPDTSLVIGGQRFSRDDLQSSLQKFNSFWTYMDTIKVHGYTRAAMSVIGRSALGAWWKLRKHEEYDDQAKDLHRKKLFSFYNREYSRGWKNIKDFYSFAFDLLIAVMYLRYFGSCAFEVIRNGAGQPIGMNFLFGMVVPNVDKRGNFKSPAFIQYLSRDPGEKVEFKDPEDIVYIINPDWEGSPLGGSDIEALGEYTLPLDIYLQSAAAHYMQNRDRPEAIYQMAADTDDESFERFVTLIGERHAGVTNLGRSPIVVTGDVKVQELSRLPSDLPYQEARGDTRDEILAVAGTGGAKLGLTRDLSNANLREMRREFHETNMIPLFKLIELAFYEQVHVRLFGFSGWEFKFNYPDFLTAVERATVDMRYYGMNAYNPNEIRYRQGLAHRQDEFGDLYSDQLQIQFLGRRQQQEPQGSPPEGRETDPDDPSQIGEPTLDDDDPVRGDGHDDVPQRALVDGLKKWRKFALKRLKDGRPLRPFECSDIPDGLADIIQIHLQQAVSCEIVDEIFNVVLEEVGGKYGGSQENCLDMH